MGVRPENTPNPNAIKFTTDKMIFEGNDSVSVMPGEESEHEILNELMQLEGVDNVFGYQHFIQLKRWFEANWAAIMNQFWVDLKNNEYQYSGFFFLDLV